MSRCQKRRGNYRDGKTIVRRTESPRSKRRIRGLVSLGESIEVWIRQEWSERVGNGWEFVG